MEARALVGWNLRRLRVARGISQDELAYSAQIDRAYVGNVERGHGNPTVTTLEKLAGVLEVELAEFFIRSPSAVLLEPLRGGRKRKS